MSTAEADPFFLNDEAGIAAGNWLRDQLDLFPDTLRWANGGIESSRFKVRADLLRGAVRAACLKDDAHDGDFHVCLGEKSIRLFASGEGVQLWISLSRAQPDVPNRIFNFGLSRPLLKRLADVAVGELDGQIVQGPRGLGRDMLKARLGSARLRLTPEPIESFPELATAAVDTKSTKFDPQRLQRSLRHALTLISGSAKSQIIRTRNGLTYAGGSDAVITVEDEGLNGVELDINAMDARLLARVLGRMRNGEASVWSDCQGYVFEDSLIKCRVNKANGPDLPVAEIQAARPDASFSLVAEELWKFGTLATIVRPRYVTLDFVGRKSDQCQNGEPIKVAICAATPGDPNACRSTLSAWPREPVDTHRSIRLSGRAWLTAAAFADHRTGVEWALLKHGAILKMTATQQDTIVSVYVPEISID